MKIQMIIAAAALLLTQNGFAQTRTVVGTVHVNRDCAESGVEVLPKGRAALCLGFDGVKKEDMIPGLEYALDGYQTEDGFFVTAARIQGTVTGIVRSNTGDAKDKFIRALIAGSVAKGIYEALEVAEEAVPLPHGGQQLQKSGDGYTCVNDPLQGYSCVVDFGKKGIEK